MYFQYDTSGVPLGFIYNGTQYFYLTNQMGDVISITDAQGNELVQYEYDEWGAVSIYTVHNSQAETTLANANPLRYRGYYYDNETGYYYLQSRYYDPSICRFINADKPIVSLLVKGHFLGENIYAYCCNNPINNKDESGCFIFTIILITIIVKSARLSQLLSGFNSEKYFKVSKSGGKGKIEISLKNNKRFCDAIYEAMQTSEKDTFKLLATYAEKIFYKKYKRDFLFDTDCIAKEIEYHVKGWLWANNYKKVTAPASLWFYCAVKNTNAKKNEMKKHCDKIDIAEKDVYDMKQATVFGYFLGLRNQYYFNNHDPYYYPSTKKRSLTYKNPHWWML